VQTGHCDLHYGLPSDDPFVHRADDIQNEYAGTGTLILVAAVMFAVLGGITVLAHIYNLNNIKAKTVGDGQHGTARWASEIEEFPIAVTRRWFGE
jgi:hypothetical protein